MQKRTREEKVELNRRKEDNNLVRAARESGKQEEARVQRWLRLAKEMFDNDDDPSPSAA